MEILYIIKTSPLSDGGGGEKRARKVTEGLASRGHNVTILCGKTDRDLEKWSETGSCDVRHVTCIPSFLFRFQKLSFYATRYLFAIASLPVLACLLICGEYDAIVENMTPYPTLSILPVKLSGIPIIAVQHEFFDRSCFRTYDPLTATIQLVVQNILRIGTYKRVIVPTSHVARKLDEYGVDASHIVVIPNGVDADRYYRPDVERDPTKLLTVGRLTKRKGQDMVLRAFREVHQQQPETHLHVLGDGPARGDLEELAVELGIDDSATFHGYVDGDRKVELMNEAGLFVFASRQEGFGLVLLEAMAAGLPIVATRLPVYEDFFEDGINGHLLKTRDPSGYGETVLRLLERPDRMAEIGSRNRQRASDFSWSSTIDHTEDALETVASLNQTLNER